MTNIPASSAVPPARKGRSKGFVRGLVVLLLLGLAFFLGRRFAPRQAAPGSSSVQAGGENGAKTETKSWTCSMHPQVRLDGPGNCPICEMPVIPAGSATGGGDGAPILTLSEHAVAMASVETTPVVHRELRHEIRAVGKIQYSEWSLATIMARVDGYAERLFVDFTGVDIKKGDHLVEVYSPTLLVAQEE